MCNGGARTHSTMQRWMRDAFGFAQKTVPGHGNPRAVTQLLLKPSATKEKTEAEAVFFFCLFVLFDSGFVRRAGEQIFLGYSVNMFIIHPVSRAGGQMCARVCE